MEVTMKMTAQEFRELFQPEEVREDREARKDDARRIRRLKDDLAFLADLAGQAIEPVKDRPGEFRVSSQGCAAELWEMANYVLKG